MIQHPERKLQSSNTPSTPVNLYLHQHINYFGKAIYLRERAQLKKHQCPQACILKDMCVCLNICVHAQLIIIYPNMCQYITKTYTHTHLIYKIVYFLNYCIVSDI